MKEEWKVYIKGVQGRGEEVKQALINLGGYAVRDYNYTVSDCLYYINHNEEIRCTKKTTEIGKIIMDNYREIKLSEQWKDGDIIFSPKFESFAVYGYDGSDNPTAIYCHVTKTDIISYPTRAIRCDYRLATPEEIKQFHELLHKHNKDWDSEKKQLVDWRWKPKDGEEYFFIGNKLEIYSFPYNGETFDKVLLSIGNCFHTREEAEAAAERVKKALKGE